MTASINVQCIPTPILYLGNKIPEGVLLDESGNPILDETGNYIFTDTSPPQ